MDHGLCGSKFGDFSVCENRHYVHNFEQGIGCLPTAEIPYLSTKFNIMTPNIQKSWVVVGQGDPSKVLELRTDVPVLSDLRSGECLVKIMAAAFNPVSAFSLIYPYIRLFFLLEDIN